MRLRMGLVSMFLHGRHGSAVCVTASSIDLVCFRRREKHVKSASEVDFDLSLKKRDSSKQGGTTRGNGD